MNIPQFDSTGACLACAGGWVCAYHQKEAARRWNDRARALSGLGESIRQSRLRDIASRFELESDEGGTALEKAARMLAGGEAS